MPLPASLSPKAPGQLIKAEDWNALVSGVNAMESSLLAEVGVLDARLDVVDASLTVIESEVEAAQTDIAALRLDVNTLLANTYRITMETSKVNYALGELAEMSATVRDLQNNIPAPVNGERPWVDFVSTWGQLRALPGFVSRAGVGERSISVQTNAQGVARVRLAADIVEDMTEDTELEFNAFLGTVVDGTSNTLTFGEIVLNANTPSDQPVRQAYNVVRNSYDNPQAGGVRNYIDSYYHANSSKLSGKVVSNFTNQRRERWRDHHITVLAFGKADSDPRTPDAARGANSIQLNFRDWIGPWILVDYLPGFTQDIPNLINVLTPAISLDFTQSANQITNVVQNRVQNLGLLGKTRQYEAFRGAFDALNTSQPVAFMPQLRESMKAAVSLQQNFQQSQVATPGGGGEEIALQAFSNTAVRANSEVSGIGSQVQQVVQQVAQVQTTFQQQVQTLQQSVTAIGGRMDATLAEGGQLQQIRSTLNVVNDQVQALRSLGDPSTVTERINFIASLDNRLARLERGT
jgi:hypothetical protein